MLFIQIPQVSQVRSAAGSVFTKLSARISMEVSEFRTAFPTIVCLFVVVAGAALSAFSLLLLMAVEGEPITWDCQGKLALFLNLGGLTVVLGTLFLPLIFRRFGYRVGVEYL